MATTSESVTLPKYSMYQKTPVYKVGDSVVFGQWREPIVPDSSDVIYTVDVTTKNRLDIISNNFYGTPSLWWVIATVNNTIDAQSGIDVGDRLRVPIKSRLSSLNILKN